jgi:hypothetical protein
MQMMLLKPVLWSGRITAQYRNWWWSWMCLSSLVELYMSIQCRCIYIYNVHTCKLFFLL